MFSTRNVILYDNWKRLIKFRSSAFIRNFIRIHCGELSQVATTLDLFILRLRGKPTPGFLSGDYHAGTDTLQLYYEPGRECHETDGKVLERNAEKKWWS